MNFEFLDFLQGISPWWWVAIALAIATLEMATMSFFLIWPAMAALVTAAILAASPEMPGIIQLITFAVSSVILTFIGRSLFNKFGDGGEAVDETLNNRGNHFVGRMGKTLTYSSGEGSVEVDGMRWRARWPEGQIGEEGAMVRIVSADGMTLTVDEGTSQ
jgi:membrane protein implicated in regulation of membrane protease activity